MKKRFRLISLILSLVSLFSVMFTACGPAEDANITVLRIWNYDGGVGHAWLDAAIQRFTDENVDTVYETGKKGVKIKVLNTKDTNQLNNIKISNHSLYFAQGISINAMQNTVLEISDIVDDVLPGETATIQDKLSEDTKSALTAQGGYYMLPHYQSFNGVVYNRTVFEEYGLYLAQSEDDYNSTNKADKSYGFVNFDDRYDETIRTVGPDGEKGSEDDGLPSSIEEFERLCEYMIDSGVIPFIWVDGSNKSYQMALTNALWLNLEGYDGVMANFTFNSNNTETSIVRSFVGDEPQTEKVKITRDNIWDIYQQESRYYALKMSEKVFGDERYYHEYSTSSTYSHTYVQRTFLESLYGGSKPIAMILEGSYWLNEAKTSGEYAEAVKDNSEVANLDLRIMPLPILAKGRVEEGKGRNPVHLDMLSSYAFINGNVRRKHGAGVEQCAKDFLKFLYTDVSLAEFTEKSNVTKNVVYDISSTQYNNLDGFAKSVWDAKKNDQVLVPISAEVEYVKNPSEFTMFADLVLWKTTHGEGTTYPYTGFHSMGMTAKQYFEGMKKTQTWWSSLKK